MIRSFKLAARTASAGALALLASATANAAVSTVGGEGWYADFDKAVEAAKAEGKDLLVDFTGSDWCGWCIKLDEEVFAKEEWKKGVADNYILVALDFPRSDEAKAKVPNPERNSELQEEYGVRGFPTILLMTADGDAYGKTGYQAGGPAKYLEHMAELQKGKEQMAKAKELAAAFEKTSGDERWKSFEEGIEVYESLTDSMPFASMLRPVAEWGFENDPENERGARLRSVVALLSNGVTDDEYLDAAVELDPKNEKGAYEKVVQARFRSVRDDESANAAVAALEAFNEMTPKDKTVAFELNFQAAMWLNGPLDDAERAKVFAAKAKEIGTDDEDMMKALDEMLG